MPSWTSSSQDHRPLPETAALRGTRRLRKLAAPAVAALSFALPAAADADVAASVTQACPGANVAPTAATLGAAEQATLCGVNAVRAREGLAPLRMDGKLERASRRTARRWSARACSRTSFRGATRSSRACARPTSAAGASASARCWPGARRQVEPGRDGRGVDEELRPPRDHPDRPLPVRRARRSSPASPRRARAARARPTRWTSAGSSGARGGRAPARPPRARVIASGRDVLVHAGTGSPGRRALDLDQPLVVVAVGGLDASRPSSS